VTHGVPSLYVAQPSVLTDSPSSETIDLAAIFLSSLATRNVGGYAAQYAALTWGGFDATTGNPVHNGTLQGDGGMLTLGGRQSMHLLSRRGTNYPYGNGGGTISPDPQVDGSTYLVKASGVTTAAPLTFAFSTASGWAAAEGDEFQMEFVIPNGSVGPITITWPGDFVFAALDGVLPSSNSSGASYRIHYVFRYRDSVWVAERNDY